MLKRLSNLSNRGVLGILLIMSIISSFLSLAINLTYHSEKMSEWIIGWLQNFSTEMFGAFLTFALIELILGNRQEKERLIRQLGSSVNEEAIRAVEELRAHGWLSDGSLKGADLRGANLQGANFVSANLGGAILARANLQEANLLLTNLQEGYLREVNLQKASLGKANLQRADLGTADLQAAYLRYADLQGARLVQINLQDANLELANLQDTKFEEVQFNENTMLPDGSKWNSFTDIRRFTDPTHPHFWRSDDSASPALRRRRKGNTE